MPDSRIQGAGRPRTALHGSLPTGVESTGEHLPGSLGAVHRAQPHHSAALSPHIHPTDRGDLPQIDHTQKVATESSKKLANPIGAKKLLLCYDNLARAAA